MQKQVHDPTRNVDRPPRRDEREGSRKLESDVERDDRVQQMVDEASEDSFPASDPPSWTVGTSVVVEEQREQSAKRASERGRGGGAQHAEEAQTRKRDSEKTTQRADEAQTGKRDSEKTTQRADKRATGRPRTDDEDTLDMRREADADRASTQRSRGAGQPGAVPERQGDRDEAVKVKQEQEQESARMSPGAVPEGQGDRDEAVKVKQEQERARVSPARGPEHADADTDLPGRSNTTEGPHQAFPGEPKVSPPKPILH